VQYEKGVSRVAKILINDLRRHSAAIRQTLVERIASVVDSGWYVLGAECEAFERSFAEYCGTAHCISLNNGTDALELGLRAIGVKSGSNVATVANAGLYSVTAMMAIGAKPVFVDVDERTQLMSLEALRTTISEQHLDAVIITHLFGLLHDMPTIVEICSTAGIPVLEDCAQAHGAAREGRRAGSFGKVATYSFYPTKNLGALGDGGAVNTSEASIAERLRLLRQYGWDRKYHSIIMNARNTRLDEMQAAVLNVKLPYLEKWNRKRREIASRYSLGIKHPHVACPPEYGEEYVAHLYVIQCDNRDALRQHLEEQQIATDIHYPIPDYRQPCLSGQYSETMLPHTEKFSNSNLTLPCFPELSDAEVDRIIAAVNAW
jgi:dTDP-4-amino-4,6-dideoxygalactose transaminase